MAMRITVNGKILTESIEGSDFFLTLSRNCRQEEIELSVQPEHFPLVKCGGGTVMRSRLSLNEKGLVNWDVWFSFQQLEKHGTRVRQSVYITEQRVKDLVPGRRFSLPTGRGRKLRDGSGTAVVTIGTVGNFAAEAIARAAAEGIVDAAHYDLRFAKPLDEEMLHEIGGRFRRVITVEDGILRGGVGEAVTAFFNRHGYAVKVRSLGIDDRFVEHGSLPQLYRLCGYDADGIYRAIIEISRPKQ